MALAERAPRHPAKGRSKPRISPPTPAKSDIAGFRDVAASIGITPMPWQETSARYTEALNADGRHLFKEVCEVAGRQNGKTEKLVILIVKRLRAGRRIILTAQDRQGVVLEVFGRVADIMVEDQSLFPERNGRRTRPRFANGQEKIELTNGGRLKIVAPTRQGARGGTNDDVIIDELREMDSWDFIGAAKPTMTASPDPQIIYLSNAGDDSSVVLNSIRERAATDPRLAYLEWSAAPERPAGDREGWLEANPAIGHIPTMFEYLSGEYESHRLGGTLSIFETEHLCRWVSTMRERLVDEFSWVRCQGDPGPVGSRPCLAVSMDPKGKRASVALAWMKDDGTIGLRLVRNMVGDPIDTAAFGEEIRGIVANMHIKRVGFDPGTDRELVKYFPRPKPEAIGGQLFHNASAQFVNAVNGNRLRWDDADAVTDDLTWTSRKLDRETGSYQAVRAQDDRPITASLAAIRAVWLASGPLPATPRVWT
jgi:hypothetical protein